LGRGKGKPGRRLGQIVMTISKENQQRKKGSDLEAEVDRRIPKQLPV